MQFMLLLISIGAKLSMMIITHHERCRVNVFEVTAAYLPSFSSLLMKLCTISIDSNLIFIEFRPIHQLAAMISWTGSLAHTVL
jgi:hypothetical protein